MRIVAGLAPAVLFLATVPVATVNGSLAMFAWLLLLPLERVIDRTLDPDRRAARG